jgi:preprotein translocase subunit SecF
VVPGLRYGIDFLGGTNVIARFSSDVTVNEVREAIDAMGIDTGDGDTITTCDSQGDGVGANGAEVVFGRKIVVH